MNGFLHLSRYISQYKNLYLNVRDPKEMDPYLTKGLIGWAFTFQFTYANTLLKCMFQVSKEIAFICGRILTHYIILFVIELAKKDVF